MPTKVHRIERFSFSTIIDALVASPYFVPGETIISIGTSSTEPLGGIGVIDDVMKLLDEIQNKHQLRNPIWLVTKAGVPDYFLSKISQIVKKTKALILTPTANGLNKTIEPCQNNRFLNIKFAQELGAQTILYLRPLVPEWGSTLNKIDKICHHAKESFNNCGPSAIVIGGLRWSEGIEYGLQLRGIEWPSSLQKIENKKDFDSVFLSEIKKICHKYYSNIPVFTHSSCALSFVLNQSDVGLHFLDKSVCLDSVCPEKQRQKCINSQKRLKGLNLELCIDKLKKMGVECDKDVFVNFLNGKDSCLSVLERQIITKVVSECLQK